MKNQLIIGILILFGSTLFGQDKVQTYLQGYAEELAGKRFGYHSPFPEVNTSLLLRGQADFDPIAWKTEKIPADYHDEFIRFIWLFGMDVTSDPVEFNLSVNGQDLLSFSSSKTSDLGPRVIKGDEGAELTLNITMLDKYADQMGFAILKLPASAINPGEPATLKISTETTDNNAWFMTYKASIEEQINIYQNKVVVKSKGKLFHSVSADFIHIGSNTKATVKIGDIESETLLKAGFNKLEINVPKVVDSIVLVAGIQIGNQKPFSKNITVSPIKEWEIFLVQHTHTDIGYTRPQTEILPEHLRYIDNALDFCDQTDDYPDASKFRWTCETSWSVREYLKSRPQAQIDRLLQRLEEGRIEATGMFLNFSEIADESALAAQTKTLRMLKNKGINITTAMQNDVNGIGWCMIDYYHNTDVKYLTMGIHAHRARLPFDKPTSFWWQSPAGNRLLAYRSEHYQHGNSLGLTSGQQDDFRNNLSQYLSKLENKGYPYNKISLQFSGYVTDNSPPSVGVSDIIRAWNDKYEWPKLRSTLAREFMIFLDEQHADDIPEQEVAWPDWWTDGVASAANETKVIRNTQAEMPAITSVFSMAKMLGLELPPNIQSEIDEVYDNILFYDEHTHGAAESVSDPLAQNTINQWGMKSAYAWEAAKKSQALAEKAMAFIEPAIGKSSLPTIAIFNTLNWMRSGMVDLFIQNAIIPAGSEFTITDAEGNKIPYQQHEQRMEGSYYSLWVEDIPPYGYKTLQVNVGQKPATIPAVDDGVFENDFYKLTILKNKGVVSQIYDKDLQENLIDENDTLTLGQFLYEQLANRQDLERLTNNTRDTIYRPLELSRAAMQNIRVLRKENGEIYQSIFLNGDMPICADDRGVSIEIRLYHHQKKIEFLYSMFKLAVTTPESVYVAFPFSLEDGKLAFEAQGGVVYPGINQLAGTSSDWNTIQNFAVVRNDKSQITFVSPEAPLVQFGEINTGRYYYRLHPKTNHIFSWVLNNYWVTNFKASQQGELRWTYNITSSKDNSDIFATKFGWSNRVPLLSRVIMPGMTSEGPELVSRSLIDLGTSNILLVNTTLSADGAGIILHLREVEGDHAILDIRRLLEETGATSIHEVNILEEEMAALISPLLIEHFETKFLKLEFD